VTAIRAGLLLAVACLAAAGCGSSSTSTSTPTATGEEVRASVPRASAPVAPADAAALAQGNSTFAGRILAHLAAAQPTLALSPFSISDALAMTYAGARGQTASEMAGALDVTLPPTRLFPAWGALAGSLEDVNQPGATLSVANALYGQRGMAFQTAFLTLLARYYGAGVRTVDFEHAAAQAVAEINAWVSQRTDAKIPSLLSAADVDDTTRLVLVNAVYLNAKWAVPFTKENTAPAPFHAPGGTVNVATMNQLGQFGYRRHAGYAVLELPYRGGRLAFDVLLPDPGRLPALLRTLAGGGLAAAVSGLQDQHVQVALPKLTLRTRFELAATLGALGMPVAFTDRADFSGIAGTPGDLRISNVIHEAYMRVDEAGTEAAAATAVSIATAAAPGPAPIQFRVDRPFMFVLRDTTTGAILFAGTVSQP
jgi:serpin B